MKDFKFGIFTLGDHVYDAATGDKVSEIERMEEIIEMAKLAEEHGFDIFAVGESHQEHFISQAHALILAAIARETKTIELSSAATIISTSDPVRVYENFATLDLLSNGRAEIVAGRASRIGLFDLLGYDLKDYEALFEEKFELLLKLNEEPVVNWEGRYRKTLKDAVLYPKPLSKLPIWRAVGGHPESARVAGIQGVPMMLATIAGPVVHFNRTVEAYRKYFNEYQNDLSDMRVGITSLLYIEEDRDQAYRNYYKYIDHAFKQANGHGFSPEIYVDSLDIRNSLLLGDPELIIEKLVYQYKTYRHERQLFQMDLGGIPFERLKKEIEILGRDVLPVVRARIKEIDREDSNENTSN